MNMLSMYSGIGGIDLAAHWAGMTTVAMCEQDDFCRRVLTRHWPGVPIFESDEAVTAAAVRELGIGRVDLIGGGPPCQPFSVAGDRAGTADPRHRWPFMLNAVKDIRPAWVVVENVAGFSDVAERLVRPDLEGVGYATVRFDVPAASVGAPHRRERIFVVAYSDERGRRERRLSGPHATAESSGGVGDAECSERWPHDTARPRDVKGQNGRREEAPSRSAIASPDGMADAGQHGRQQRGASHDDSGSIAQRDIADGRHTGADVVADANDAGRRERRGTESVRTEFAAAERGGGGVEFADRDEREERRLVVGTSRRGADGGSGTRQAESRLVRVADGIADRLDATRWPAAFGCEQFDYEPPRVTTEREFRRKRLKAIGNAVVPQQVYPILAIIQAIHEAEVAA